MSLQSQGTSRGYRSLEVEDATSNEVLEAATHHNYGLKVTLLQTVLIAGFFVALLCFTAYVSIALANSKSGCLGAPYLYISHHDSHNVLKYTRDGCPLSQNVLWFGRATESVPGSIRTLLIHPYKGVRNSLFVTNAGNDARDPLRILVFDTCSGLNGMRSYVKTLVDARNVPGAQHTYSIAFDGNGDMFASFQHTDTILRFSNTTFKPVTSKNIPWYDDLYSKEDYYSAAPPINNQRNYTKEKDFFEGTFLQVS